jgi:hydroxymethylbilane synthase
MEQDEFTRNALQQLNHRETEICTFVERQFLKTLEGGCTAPIGALARIENDTISFSGVLLSLDGRKEIVIDKQRNSSLFQNFGELCAKYILENGGSELMQSIKIALKQ